MTPTEQTNAFSLESLPELPQSESIRQFAPVLWQVPGVVALWIGGSLGRGTGDVYSDVDWRVAVTPDRFEDWKWADLNALFGGECVGQTFLAFGESAFLHHLVLRNGDIYDLWVQPASAALSPESVLVLGCRDDELRQKLRDVVPQENAPPPPAEPETIRRLLVDYWIMTHKQRKVLHRGLTLVAQTGVGMERDVLRRLWYVQATGTDYGTDRAVSIFSLTDMARMVEQTQGEHAASLLGASLATPTEICRAIEAIRDEISRVGRELATRFHFKYPHELEITARDGWAAFLVASK